MSEIVERIAKALAFDDLTEKGRADCVWPDSFGELELTHYRKNARAVIAAMREPTYSMRMSTPPRLDEVLTYRDSGDIWKRMIDEALK